MPPSFGDIENELREIATEAAYLESRLARIGLVSVEHDAQARWEATLVCASAAEKLYTGCERVMAQIVAEVDGVPVVRADGWHSALLRRVAAPFPGVREAVISGECQAVLNVMRAFRHRERNSYGIQMDFDVVVERARQAVVGFALFRAEVEGFYRHRGDEEASTLAE